MCLKMRKSAYVQSGDEALAYIKTLLSKHETLTREEEYKLVEKVQRRFGLSEEHSAELLTTVFNDPQSAQ